MRAFGKHIVIIISVLMLSALILEYCYKRAYKSDVARNKVQLVANLKNVHIDYIFLGSSRTENHIDCDVIEKITGKSCINLGLQAGRIKDYRIIVELLQSNAVYFDKLFIQIDYSYNFDDYSKGFLAQLMPFVKNDNLPEVRYQELELPFYYDLPYLRFASNGNNVKQFLYLKQVLPFFFPSSFFHTFFSSKGYNTTANGGCLAMCNRIHALMLA